MNIRHALSNARDTLSAQGIEEPNLESELLLRHTLKMDRATLFLEMDTELSANQRDEFQQLVNRRISGEPSAYITGHREFYGLDFQVNPSVLIPRPDSELLVEKAVEAAKNYSAPTIADIGTGSGAIAISLAVNLPQARVYGTDISASSLDVAKYNCQRHGVGERVRLLEGDLLEPLPEPVDIITANLPYVPETESVNTHDYEPSLALYGGPDGLRVINRLCEGLQEKLNPGGFLFLEMGLGQGEAVTCLLKGHFPGAALDITADLAGIERVISVSFDENFASRGVDLVKKQ